ncbi:tripartite motif-containing protein 2-like [Stylophora pistillata]|nr:tripartite motif-containing protein 2-like [Stylophora pistillata]
MVKRSSNTDVMQNKGTLKQRFEELRAINPEVPLHQNTVYMRFTADSTAGLILGSIQTEKEDAKKSTLQGIDQPKRAGVEAELLLSPKTSSGEMCDLQSEQIEFLVESADDVSIIITSVNKNENGTFLLKFIPIVPGTYNLEVKMYGEKLPICPVNLLVKECELVLDGELDLKLFRGDTLHAPMGITVNMKGAIAVTDLFDHSVYLFDNQGDFLQKIGCEGTYDGHFNFPTDVIFIDDDEILVSDQNNHRIQRFSSQTGTFIRSFGKHGSGKGQFNRPFGLFMDDQEQIVVTDVGNKKIHVLTKDGESIFTFGDNGPEELSNPLSCVRYKDKFFVSDMEDHSIKVFDITGQFLYKFGSQGTANGQFMAPFGLHIDRFNCLLVCDRNNARVQKFSLDGRFLGKSTSKLGNVNFATEMPDGRILVTSVNSKKLHVLRTK